MEKIVIIGPSGAGKSTLAQTLGSILKIKVYHLDRFFWQPDWQGKARDARREILQGILQKKHWIIEGTYLNSSQELHLQAADTIIFLDISPLVCLPRIIKRHHDDRGRFRRDIPKGSTDKITLRQMLKVLAFPFRDRRTINQKLHKYTDKQIFWLRSTKEAEDYVLSLNNAIPPPASQKSLPPPREAISRSRVARRL